MHLASESTTYYFLAARLCAGLRDSVSSNIIFMQGAIARHSEFMLAYSIPKKRGYCRPHILSLLDNISMFQIFMYLYQ